MKSYQIPILFLLLFTIISTAQVKDLPAIKVNARAQKDQILLRWAIDNPIAWQKSFKTGFIIERHLIKKDNKLVTSLEKKILTPVPLIPYPLEMWMDLIQKDHFAAVIAQAIYGDSFEVTNTSKGKILQILNVAQDLEQRYTFALYAADMSFEGAVKAGWGWIDTDVKPNEEYAYTILPADNLKVQEASFLIGLKDFEPLPAPIDLMSIAGDKNILLTWEYESFKNIYTSYMIEKSEDGINFKALSNTPLTNLNDKPDAPAKRMYHIDTIPQNDIKYHYRVYGVSPFGEKGLFSKTTSAAGIASLIATPRLSDYTIKDNNEVILQWEYPNEAEQHVSHYQINLSEKDSGPYTIVGDNIAAKKRSFNYTKLKTTNYFTISAIGKNNQKLTSQSILVQPIDSIPPAIPTGLIGQIDSTGVAHISWKTNTEKDLLGYRVLRANTPNEEFVGITKGEITTNTFQDTLSLKSLNNKIYYQIIAEDFRHNISEPSEILVLDKPDIIPPTAPIFTNYSTENGTIKIEWIRSYSEDVATHQLFRKEKETNTPWQLIYTSKDTLQSYTDQKVEKNKTYQYAIYAIDQSGLQSAPSTFITITAIDLSPQKALKNLESTISRDQKTITFTWAYTTKNNVVEIAIYKNEKEQPPTLLTILKGDTTQFIDKQLKMNTSYQYHFKPILPNNSPAQTETLTIQF